MSKYEVLSINLKTKGPEQMSFASLDQAESHERRAKREGRRLVKVVDSPAMREAWKKKAQKAVERLN
jgi:hypothetical protein